MPAFIPFIIGAAAWGGRLALTFGRVTGPSVAANTILSQAMPGELAGATLTNNFDQSARPIMRTDRNSLIDANITKDQLIGGDATYSRENRVCTPLHPMGTGGS